MAKENTMKLKPDHIEVNCPEQVKSVFGRHLGDDGALFWAPVRVDLIRK
jgi:hypothetical protein